MEAEGWYGLCELPYWYNTSLQALEVRGDRKLEGEDRKIDTAGIEDCDRMVRGFAQVLPLNLDFIPSSE